MPAFQPLSRIFSRGPANATAAPSIDVVCSWPLSSNYGPGSRVSTPPLAPILYYILVAACVAFRKTEWLRNACLAAALVLPAISAVEAIVLASAHVNGAVDMDIYGAFQFCSIGILAAPLTVRLSRTYFYDPGRNIIFVWTILVLMGLLALCVEFYRVNPTPCYHDDNGNPIPLKASLFLATNATCGMTCNTTTGPFSMLRGGSNNNIYIIPAPEILTFNAVMLLTAGFCIPAILSLFFTWDKILEINWKSRRDPEHLDDQIEGANITVGELKGINNVVRQFLSVIEVPLFGGIILTIIGIGEANFFSKQVIYETEPMASIGQWGPIAGVILAGIGSLYLWLTTDVEDTPVQGKPRRSDGNSASSVRTASRGRNPSPGRVPSPGRPSNTYYPSSRPSNDNALGIRAPSPHEIGLVPTITTPDFDRYVGHSNTENTQSSEQPTAGRHRVRRWLTSAGEYMGNAAHNKLDTSDYSDQKAHRYPVVPGEKLRNPDLERTRTQYTRLREENSRQGSTYSPSIASGYEPGCNSPTPTPEPPNSPRTEASPTRKPKRRDTLEVPPQLHGHRRSESLGDPGPSSSGAANVT